MLCRHPACPGVVALSLVVAMVLLSGCQAMRAGEAAEDSPEASRATATTTSTAGGAADPVATVPVDQAPVPTALGLLGTLAVKGRAAKTGYSRDQYGQAWADTNRNGCDTRNDILKRDLTAITFKQGTGGCVVLSGTLADPYTRTSITFARGGASEVDIDHVVALGNSWVTGAARWPFRKRLALSNDPLNLLAVDASANRQKGDGDAATWLPSNRTYRCAYLARQVAVKAKYQLWITPAEKDALGRVLRTCPPRSAPLPRSHRSTGEPPAPHLPTL